MFFDNQLISNTPGERSVRCVAWNRIEEAPLLAVAEGSQVRIFREEGEEVTEAVQVRNIACTSLCWHPHSKVLAAGWDDGSLTFQEPGSSSSREDREVHRGGAILCIVFNPAGSRCITTDNNGVVAVWKTDGRGAMSQMCHYRKTGPHDKVIFRTLTHAKEPNLENPPFFFGGEQGTVFLADDFGLCSERYKTGSPLVVLEYYHQKDMVILITKGMMMSQFNLDAEGKVTNETKLKLSCGPHPEKLQGVWAGPGLLATCSHESIVRFWNIADDESYIVSLQGIDERNSFAGDKVTSIDFNPRKRVLACGTRGGRVVQWRCSQLSGAPKSEAAWQVLPVVTGTNAGACIDKISWGPGDSLLHARTERSSFILSEAQLNTAISKPFLAFQTSPLQVMLYQLETANSALVGSAFRIRGLSLSGNMLLIWNSKQAAVFDIDTASLNSTMRGSFKHEGSPIVAAVLISQGQDRIVAMATGSKIEFANLQGNVQKVIQFSEEMEGSPICLDLRGSFLAASTNKSVIRVWNVSRAQPKQIGNPRKFTGVNDTPLGEIRSVRVNSDGTRVSLIVDQRLAAGGAHGGSTALRVPDARLFVYDMDADAFMTYHVGKSSVPVAHSWDVSDGRLLCCEVVPQALAVGGEDSEKAKNGKVLSASIGNETEANTATHCVITLFATGQDQILQQDRINCVEPENGAAPKLPIALAVPYIYFARLTADMPPEQSSAPATITQTVLRDFAGLDRLDAETTAALMDFSFHLASGNTDEAYRSVKGVRSTNVWESMSKMCVKTGRLDVAQKCLGQMAHARAAGALRTCPEPEAEAKLATVAVHLDMVDDAEQLLRRCGRFDLLNQLYQAGGQWDKALEVAKTKDRVHLKPTHYAFAQYLEALDDVKGALSHYELSGTYRNENPRLLCSLGLVQELEKYVEQSDDAQLHRWYAQYLESKSNLQLAAQEYKKANDWLSLCRVACCSKDLEQAQKICDDSQDQAACYHLARHLEAEGRTKEAINYFQIAGRISHALRLAQEQGMDGDLMSLALSSGPANMAQAAKYYEQRGQHSKAVILYQKAGYQKRALELCFSANLFDALRKIADDLNPESDPEVLQKCAEFFMQHNQHDKAVHLLCMSSQYDKAVELCNMHDVHITDEMAERMTPEKTAMDPAVRAEVLQNIAKLCRKQGSFQLACKKFTQAGDKLKAMKSLLKSSDTEKIIFFAGTARQPDIYVLAGNYLQSLDWHNDPEIMKNIIQFYSKAKAHDKLASFYDACAQVEIDEYRDYEKASGALRESLKYLAKAAGATADQDSRVISVQNRIAIIEQFAGIKKLARSEPDQMVAVCERMLGMPDIEHSVRIGDIFAQLVEHYAEVRDYESAHRMVERMRARGIILTPFLDHAQLMTIYNAVGAAPPDQSGASAPGAVGMRGGAAGAQAAQMEDDVSEEIEEDA